MIRVPSFDELIAFAYGDVDPSITLPLFEMRASVGATVAINGESGDAVFYAGLQKVCRPSGMAVFFSEDPPMN